MSREQKSKIIGTTEYLVTQMDAVSALKIQTKLIKILGPSVLSLLDDKTENTSSKISKMIPQLMENFDDELVNELVLSLFKSGVFVKENNVPKVVDFATHFAGKPTEMWQVMAFILEANFNLGELLGSDLPTTKTAAEDLTRKSIM